MPGDDEGLVRKTISLDPAVYAIAVANAAKRGFKKSFSAYMAWLIERDHAGSVDRESLKVLKMPAKYDEDAAKAAEEGETR